MTTTTTIDHARLAQITRLDKGAHAPDGIVCLMEATAKVAGESWSDHPACVDPALTQAGIQLNDDAPTDADRQRLRPLIVLLIGTRNDGRQAAYKAAIANAGAAYEAAKANAWAAYEAAKAPAWAAYEAAIAPAGAAYEAAKAPAGAAYEAAIAPAGAAYEAAIANAWAAYKAAIANAGAAYEAAIAPAGAAYEAAIANAWRVRFAAFAAVLGYAESEVA